MNGEVPAKSLDLFPDVRSRVLYQQGLARQWQLEEAVDWSRLSLARLATSIREAMAAVYADILYAEAFGLDVATRLVELAPEGWLREFAVLQRVDEARHVDFFVRVQTQLGADVEPPRDLRCLEAELARTTDYDELMLHSQIMETGARALFVGNATRSLEVIGKGIRLPGTESIIVLMRALVDLVGRDESRHIAFGMHCLRNRLDRCDVAERHALEQRATISARLMYGSFAERSSMFARLGLPPAEVLDRVWQAMRKQLGRIELDIGATPPHLREA